ncbi:hypothetical protein DL98DRAFT_601976 [Cadophora sp. DSE1049]|nr:hypothetical protein DL98DRAFT_601976 [Cadophora sp. DSE1049]
MTGNDLDAMLADTTGLCKVLEICGGDMSGTFKSMMDRTFLSVEYGQRRLLPPALMSDEAGLRIWKDITRLPDYYQTRDEISLLEAHGKEIASHLSEGCVLIDLGCGDMRKVKPLLDTLEASQKSVLYLTLDISKPTLEECLSQLRPKYRFVRCARLWGTFADALKWAATSKCPNFFLSWAPSMVMTASIASRFGTHTTMTMEYLKSFMRNALSHSNEVLGHEWYRPDDWKVLGILDPQYPIHHRFVFRAVRLVQCEAVQLEFGVGEEIDCYEVFKNGPDILRRAFAMANLSEIGNWTAPSGSFPGGGHYLRLQDWAIGTSHLEGGPGGRDSNLMIRQDTEFTSIK